MAQCDVSVVLAVHNLKIYKNEMSSKTNGVEDRGKTPNENETEKEQYAVQC